MYGKGEALKRII